VGLRGDGVLVRLDGVGAEDGARGVVVRVAVYGFQQGKEVGRVSVYGRHNGEVVLEFVEVVLARGGKCNGVVERVGQGGIVRAKRHFADDVREVESWGSSVS
jgi:hypothetical protein